jgi:Ca-activated chloride channel family protein
LIFSSSKVSWHFCLVLIGASLTAIATLRARQENQNALPQAQLKVRTELVHVGVSVADARGNPVSGLTKANFRILDDGVAQPITYFASIEAPAQVLVLVETRPAVYLIHTQHLAAANALLDGLAPDDEVALASYDQAPRAILPFTADKAALARALGDLHYILGMGELNLFGALSATLDWLAPVPGKKALVLLSTGLDSGPPERWDELQTKLRASEVTIFAVALGGELRSAKPKKKRQPLPGGDDLSFAQADKILEQLAEISGGRAYFPRGGGDFAAMYRQIAATLRHQYVLGFEPPAHDGRFHTIAVQVLDQAGLPQATAGPKADYRVFTRQGYQATAL